MTSAVGRAVFQPYLDTLMDTAPVGLGLFDSNSRCVAGNDRLARLLGVSPEELVGREAGASLPGMPDVIQARMARVLETGEARRDLEAAFEDPSDAGRRRAVRLSFEPVRDRDAGRIVGVLAIVVDLSQQAAAQAEAAAEQTRAALRARLRAELLATPLEPRAVARKLAGLLVTNRVARHAVVAFLDPASERLDTQAVVSADESLQVIVSDWIDSHSFPRGIPPADAVLDRGRPLRFAGRTPDELADQLSEPFRAVIGPLGLRAMLLAPIRAHGEVTGLLALGRDEPFDADDETLIEQVDEFAGIALANARLLRRVERYLAVVEAMAGQLTLPAVYDAVLPVLRETLAVDTVRLLLLSSDGSHLYAGVTVGNDGGEAADTRIRVGEGFSGRIAADQRRLVVEKAERSPFATDAGPGGGPRSLAGVPVADHELLGVLQVATLRRHRFQGDDLELLQLTADRLALAIRQHEAEQALQRSAAFSRSVLEHVVDAVVTADEQGRITTVNPAALRLFGYGEHELVGQSVAVLMPEPERSAHERQLARYLETGESRVIGRVREVWARRADGTVFPVELGVSEVNVSGQRRFFTGVIHDITARRRAQDELRHQALHDDLTGLPNRVLFGDHLDEALARSARSGAPVGVLVVDLDDFKPVNDTFGHPAGDELLRQVGQRLRGVLRPADTVARLGGDEFGVVVQDARRDEDVVRVAQRIRERFQVPFVVEGRQLACTASIGVAQSAWGRERPSELLRHADAALYQAKEKGRNRFELFDEPLRTRLRTRVRREDELARAIEQRQVEPWFQPILDLRSDKLVAVEVLARWRHPERGLLGAEEFVRLAEDTGQIVALGRLVMEQAGIARRRWADRGGFAPALSINLSAAELTATGSVDVYARIDCPATDLWVELRESTVAEGSARLRAALTGLRRQGGRVAVDGFGAGFSSVGRLAADPADLLKVDRRYVTAAAADPAARVVVEGSVALGRALGLDVVAVGVEHLDELDHLRRLGCTHAQGRVIAPVVAAADVPEVLRSWR